MVELTSVSSKSIKYFNQLFSFIVFSVKTIALALTNLDLIQKFPYLNPFFG